MSCSKSSTKIVREIIKDVKPLKIKSMPILDSRSELVKSITNDLWDAVSENPCMGMAGVQIGHQHRVFLSVIPNALKAIHVTGQRPNKYPDQTPSVFRYGAFVNPQIIGTSHAANYQIESCLSLPGVFCFVARFDEIRIRYQSLVDEETRYARLQGNFARAFQHELDHLDGILITDKHVDPATVVKSKKDLNIINLEIQMLSAEFGNTNS